MKITPLRLKCLRGLFFYNLEIGFFVNLSTIGDVLKPLHYGLVIIMLNIVSPVWVPTLKTLRNQFKNIWLPQSTYWTTDVPANVASESARSMTEKTVMKRKVQQDYKFRDCYLLLQACFYNRLLINFMKPIFLFNLWTTLSDNCKLFSSS